MEFTPEARRARLVRRHHLAGTATDATQAARDLVALHATETYAVYLSAMVRAPNSSLADVAEALYEDRSLLRILAMRRTLFVAPVEDAPVLHHAASLGVAVNQRRVLLKALTNTPTDPPVEGDPDRWLAAVERKVEKALAERGSALANQLSQDVPELRTALLPTTDKKYDVRRNITSSVLGLMGLEGRIVRGRPTGTWISRQYSWEPVTAIWPAGIPEVPQARTRLAELYLRRFGPATVTDVAWWTGWNLGDTRRALAELDTIDVGCGLVLADDAATDVPVAPTAALLPAMDPTPMGWKERTWYLPPDWQVLYDTMGNISPTIWWGGEVIGGWRVQDDGSIVTRLLLDRGRAAVKAVAEAVDALHPRLEGATFSASFPSRLDKELRSLSV